MRVLHPVPKRAVPRLRRAATAFLTCVTALAVAGCATSTPSPTSRPELAWERATIELPADVVDVAPGSTGGMICSPCHAEQASLLMGIASGDGGLLAVGVQQPPSTAIAYRSRDGRTWEPETAFDPGEDTSALAAAADVGRRVIVGTRGSAAAAWASSTPSDGTARAGAWHAAADGAALDGPPGGSASMRAVVAWHGQFVAAGSRDAAGSPTAAVWMSEDGVAWRLVSSGPAFDDAGAYGIAASDAALVVVGATGGSGTGHAVAWVSGDGERWTRVDSAAFPAGPMRAVTAAGTGFVAVGFGADDDRAVAWTSPDGRTWEQAPVSRSLENNGKAIRMSAVASDGTGLVAAGWKSDAGNGSGVVWQSTDGRVWNRGPDQVSMSGASLAGVGLTAGGPAVVGTSGYPDNDQAAAWFLAP